MLITFIIIAHILRVTQHFYNFAIVIKSQRFLQYNRNTNDILQIY